MPKYRYELTVHEDDIDIIRDDNDGMITLYLVGDIDEIDVSSVEEQSPHGGGLPMIHVPDKHKVHVRFFCHSQSSMRICIL